MLRHMYNQLFPCRVPIQYPHYPIKCSNVAHRFNAHMIQIVSLHSNQFIAYTPLKYKYQDRLLTTTSCSPTYVSGFQHRV